MSGNHVLRESHTVVFLRTAITCNVCGKVREHEKPSEYGLPDMHPFAVEGGYQGTWPGDGTRVKWDACSDCLKAWVTTFRVSPDISERFGQNPYEAKHSENGETYVIGSSWAYRKGTADPTLDFTSSWSYDEPGAEFFPDQGVYEHFKGNRYLVLDHVRDFATREALVVYVSLQDESDIWVRPAQMWEEVVGREGYSGPRFRFLYPHKPARR